MRKISVIIPCYNVEKYIENCLNSILEQTIGRNNIEIILVDDKSEDGTLEKLKEYEKKYPDNILLIICEKNGRQGTARNIGMSYATGEYISFVDADDWIRKDMYEILWNIADKEQCDLVQFRYTGKKQYYSEDDSLSLQEYKVYDFTDSEKRRHILVNSEIMNESCTTKLYKKELLLASGVSFAEGVSYEEPLFTYPLKFFVNKIAVLENALYYYRYNEQGTTALYMENPSTILEHLDVQKKTFLFVKNLDCYKTYQNEIELYFMHSFFVEPFYFMKYRNMILPIGLYRFMCKEVLDLLPKYKENPYYNDTSLIEEKKIIDLIDELDNQDDEIIQKKIISVQSRLS